MDKKILKIVKATLIAILCTWGWEMSACPMDCATKKNCSHCCQRGEGDCLEDCKESGLKDPSSCLSDCHAQWGTACTSACK